MKRQLRLKNTGVALRTRKIKKVSTSVIHGGCNSVYVNHEPPVTPVTRIQQINKLVLHFTGRSHLLDTIDLKFKSGTKEKSLQNIVVLHGLGGIGKTELAKAYGHKKLKEGENVMWVEAGRDSSIRSSFVSVARKLKICPDILSQQKINLEDVEFIAKEVYQHFSKHIKSGLFIFNNVQDMVTSKFGIGIKNYLPLEELSHVPIILITSRKLGIGDCGRKYQEHFCESTW
ncbi:unnamed protein product [Allacma fusca]|uniref:NB-ARC domain-containing protein n=1 Tax=Allacma fusca TaxID=39272 RepID=A0A8J2J0E4_9HEXA|nr:unnamed protein product [Allacma fusca]